MPFSQPYPCVHVRLQPLRHCIVVNEIPVFLLLTEYNIIACSHPHRNIVSFTCTLIRNKLTFSDAKKQALRAHAGVCENWAETDDCFQSLGSWPLHLTPLKWVHPWVNLGKTAMFVIINKSDKYRSLMAY